MRCQYLIAILGVVYHMLSTMAMQSEPGCVCSKFHYEESLLEKMIRGEIKFENLKTSVEKGLAEMTSQFADMQRGLEDQLVSIRQANKEFVQTVQGKQEEMAAKSDTALDKVGKTLTELENVKDSLKTPTVAFSSKHVVDVTLNKNQVIVFSESVYNHGDGYDTSTGVFTAPKGGVYLFTVHLCMNYAKNIHYSIVVDWTEVTNGYESSGYVCTTATATVVLQSAQKVWVKCNYDGDELYQDGHRFNIFSGVLIHQ